MDPLKLVYNPDKLEPQAQGHYEIIAVHINDYTNECYHDRAYFYMKCHAFCE
jgi:hypothetical protein